MGNSNRISEETFKKADFICIGKAGEEINIENLNLILSNKTDWSKLDSTKLGHDSIEIERFPKHSETTSKIVVKGDWADMKVVVEDVIKGNESADEIRVRFFFPILENNPFLLDIPRLRSENIFFLKKENANTYSLIEPTNSLIAIPSLPSNLSTIKEPNEKIKAVLLNGLEKGDIFFAMGAVYTLEQLGIAQDELISSYRDLTTKLKSDIKDIVISKRIDLGDTTVWKDILEISNEETYSNINFMFTNGEMKKLKIPVENIPMFAKIIHSKNRSLKEGGIRALSSIKDKSVIPTLIKALNDNNNSIKFRAVMGLTNILGPIKKEGKIVSCTLKNPNENGCIDLWEKWWETEGKKQYGEPAQ